MPQHMQRHTPRHMQRHMPHPSRLGGFTLIEVLVALFIMSIMSTLAWKGIDGLVRARQSTQGHSDHTLRLSAVVGQWEQDLAQLQRSAAAPALRFDGAAMRLTRRSPEGLRVVVWTLQGGALYRWTSPALNSVQETQRWWLKAQQWSAIQGQALRVLDDVSTWQVYYYRNGDNAWSNAQSSAGTPTPGVPAPPASGASAPDNTPEEDDGTIPAGVRLQLSLAQGQLTRDLLLPPNP